MAAAPEPDLLISARVPVLIDASAEVSLARLAPGAEAVILAVEGDGPVQLRLRDLGFVRGTRVRSIKRAPLGDPVVYELRAYRMCLRRSDADRVRVRPV